MATIALLIPCYNASEDIPRIAADAHAQTRPFDAILLYDDASTDDSINVAKQHGFTVYSNNVNHGAGMARNRLLQNATTDYVHFHDVDDPLLPNFVERMLPLAGASTVAICDCLVVEDESAEETRMTHPPDGIPKDAISYLLDKHIHLNSAIYPRQSILKAGGFEEDMRICEDLLFNINLAAKGLNFAYLPEPLAIHRKHGNSTLGKSNLRRILHWRSLMLSHCLNKLEESDYEKVAKVAHHFAWNACARGFQSECAALLQVATRAGYPCSDDFGPIVSKLAPVAGMHTAFKLRRFWARWKGNLNVPPGTE